MSFANKARPQNVDKRLDVFFRLSFGDLQEFYKSLVAVLRVAAEK